MTPAESTDWVPYVRGTILRSTEDDYAKLRVAWQIVAKRLGSGGKDLVYNLSGLERSLPIQPGAEIYDDELSPALYGDRFNQLALDHLGGASDRHDSLLLNRQTAALFAALMVVVRGGDTVIGVSPTYTHPSVVRAASFLGARLVDTAGLDAFEHALAQHGGVRLVVVTRLAVSYEILPTADLERAIAMARSAGATILLDDAGGARVGPAAFDQPRTLELDVDLGATGLDKYGTIGPRLGLLGGLSHLVSAARARAYEYGLEARPMLLPAAIHSLEQYSPERVRALVSSTDALAAEMGAALGGLLRRTPVSAQLPGEALLSTALQRAGVRESPIVPYEATAAVAMLLLREHGVLTVHFAAVPPGTSALLFKFVSPEALERFGGPRKLSRAIDTAIDLLSEMVKDPHEIRSLLLGSESVKAGG